MLHGGIADQAGGAGDQDLREGMARTGRHDAVRQPSGRSGAAVALYRNVPVIPRYFLGEFRSQANEQVSCRFCVGNGPRLRILPNSAQRRRADDAVDGSGIKSKALSLPCNSRISSVFSGGFAGAGSGVCGADGAGGRSNDVAGDGEAGGGEIAGAEAGGGALSDMSSARGIAAFACSTGLGGNGSEAGKGRPRTARTAAPANSISDTPSQI